MRILFFLFMTSPLLLLGQNYFQGAPPVLNSLNSKDGYSLVDNWEFSNMNELSATQGWRITNEVRSYPKDMDRYVLTNRPENVTVTNVDDNGSSISVLQLNTLREVPAYNQASVWQAGQTNNCCPLEYPNATNTINGIARGYDFDFTSGQVSSRNQYLYGYFEIRARLPQGSRMWPAFWLFNHENNALLREDGTSTTLPYKTELDVFEIFPDQSKSHTLQSNFHYSLHYLDDNNVDQHGFMDQHNIERGWYDVGRFGSQVALDDNITSDDFHSLVLDDLSLTSEFNTYGMEWESDRIVFYFNNMPYFQTTNPELLARFSDAMTIIFNTEVDHRGADWDVIKETMDDNNSFEIDYCRVYKKNPEITADPNNCRTGSMLFTAETSNNTDDFQWTISNTAAATIVNGQNTSQIEIQMNSGFINTFVDLTVTATSTTPASNGSFTLDTESATTFRATNLESDFDIPGLVCNGSGFEITVEDDNWFSGKGSQWAIFLTSATGVIPSGSSAISTINGASATFDGLTQDAWYTIKHGVYNSCNTWSESRNHFQVKFANSSFSEIFCDGNDGEINLSTNNLGMAHQWAIYPDDEGSSSSSSQIIHGVSVSFDNLDLGRLYEVKHGVYGGACGVSWQEERFDVYIPSFDLNAKAKISGVSLTNVDGSSTNVELTFVPDENGENHQWTIFNTDQNNPIDATAFNQIGDAQNSFSFSVNNLKTEKYYVVKHGTFGDCALWNERRYLVYINDFSGIASYKIAGEIQEQVEITEIDDNLTMAERREITRTLKLNLEDSDNISGIFPNPAHQDVVNYFNEDLNNSTPACFSLINAAGQEVYTDCFVPSRESQLNIGQQNPGIYSLIVNQNEVQATEKLVIN